MEPRPDTRLHVLDVLRGIALLGMFLVHVNNYSSGGGWLEQAYQQVVALFFDERFWAMVGILFVCCRSTCGACVAPVDDRVEHGA